VVVQRAPQASISWLVMRHERKNDWRAEVDDGLDRPARQHGKLDG
jgi:hypothetical protein